MKMKLMQLMLVVAAILAAIGIAVGLSRGEVQEPDEYEPSGLMTSFGSLVGPPQLPRNELSDAGTAFPLSLRLTPGMKKTFSVATGNAEQRRASFRITGQSRALSITYEVHNAQRFNDRPVEDSQWKQSEAKNGDEVNFVIFNQGGELVFNNQGSNSSTVTIRVED